MKKNNNKGFVLVETLIVTAFVAAIFSIILLNFYPLIGEYERRERYDDIQTKYTAYWIKKIIQDDEFIISLDQDNPIEKFECGDLSDDNKISLCSDYVIKANIKKMYISYYALAKVDASNYIDNTNSGAVKDTVKTGSYDSEFKDYINFLPKYQFGSLNDAKYRLYVVCENDDRKTYATLEVSND